MAKFNIDEWIKIARKYGAKIENVEVVRDESTDFVKIVAKNPLKEVFIEIPFPVLVYTEDMVITDTEHYVKKDKLPQDDLREMVNEYLDFIFSKERLERLKDFMAELSTFPQNLKNKLFNSAFIVSLFQEPRPERLKRMLLNARTFNFKGKAVFMPILDFVNHEFKEALNFQVTDNSIFIKGYASKTGEVFVTYNNNDSFAFLNTYFFVPDTLFAFSCNLQMQHDDKVIVVRRQVGKIKEIKNMIRIPEYEVQGNKIILSHLWIGSVNTPRRPFWSFRELWENRLGLKDSVKVFSFIKSFNLRLLTEILEELENTPESEAKRLVKLATLKQLRAISHTFEEP